MNRQKILPLFVIKKFHVKGKRHVFQSTHVLTAKTSKGVATLISSVEIYLTMLIFISVKLFYAQTKTRLRKYLGSLKSASCFVMNSNNVERFILGLGIIKV